MSLELIIGCMYSGKSTELLRRINRLKTIKNTYIIYNSVIDIRYGSLGVYTHNKSHEPCKIVDNLMDQVKTYEYSKADTIFIDEGQFYKDLYEFVKLSVETHNKNVIVLGLDGDSNRNNFGDIHRLLPLCDDIIKLKALCSICNNGSLGIFSKKILSSDSQVDVGSVNKYISVCRRCYLK